MPTMREVAERYYRSHSWDDDDEQKQIGLLHGHLLNAGPGCLQSGCQLCAMWKDASSSTPPLSASVTMRQKSAEQLPLFTDESSLFALLINEPLISGSWGEIEAAIRPGKLYRLTVEEIEE